MKRKSETLPWANDIPDKTINNMKQIFIILTVIVEQRFHKINHLFVFQKRFIFLYLRMYNIDRSSIIFEKL